MQRVLGVREADAHAAMSANAAAVLAHAGAPRREAYSVMHAAMRARIRMCTFAHTRMHIDMRVAYSDIHLDRSRCARACRTCAHAVCSC